MNRRLPIRLLAVALATPLLAACAGLWPAPYGEVAADAEPVRGEGRPNVMPPNAPSILNGHWADYDGHPGIDVIGPVGLPVLAPADGVVSASFFEPMYGHNILIGHADDSDGHAVQTRFVHLDERLVEAGQAVRRGEQIGTLGRTGLLAGGIPHLHFEVQKKAPQRYAIFQTTNPHRFWIDGPGRVTCFSREARYPDRPFLITYPVPCRDVDWRSASNPPF